jgi:hypothetical protein
MTYTGAARELVQALHHLRSARAAVYQEQYRYHEEVDELVRRCADLYKEIYEEMEPDRKLSRRLWLREFGEAEFEQQVNLGRHRRNWEQ